MKVLMNATLVELVDSQPMTDSLNVARVFKKRHTEVLRAIKNLGCSKEFTERNFASSEYSDSTGRSLPMFKMTKNGFVFLAMGFTGKAADTFKEDYINAFDEMQNYISGQGATLTAQYVKTQLQFDAATATASNAGRTLNIVGKHVKPTLLQELQTLRDKIQLHLPFLGGGA